MVEKCSWLFNLDKKSLNNSQLFQSCRQSTCGLDLLDEVVTQVEDFQMRKLVIQQQLGNWFEVVETQIEAKKGQLSMTAVDGWSVSHGTLP